jgi:uncharacterized protein YndB with AHSA1/START domain
LAGGRRPRRWAIEPERPSRTHVFSVWTDPQLIPEWWGEGTVVEEMDVRPGGTYRFRTAYGVVEGEFREVDAPERLVQTFQNHCSKISATGRS